MKQYFLAEKLKYRHTFLPFLVVAMPLMTCLLAAFLTGNYFAVDSFNWWYMMMFPGMTAIICAVVGGKDKKQQNRTIFALPVDIEKVWDAKILTAAGMTAIANGILLAGAVAGNFCLTEMFSYTMVGMPAVWMQIVALADPVLLMDVPEVRGISDVFASPCSVYGACGQPVA